MLYSILMILYWQTGAVAGDEETYETFAELFDPIIDGRHNGYGKAAIHRTDLDASKIVGGDFDTKYVLSCRVCRTLLFDFKAVRNIQGTTYYFAMYSFQPSFRETKTGFVRSVGVVRR